jgi:hypothetical protein
MSRSPVCHLRGMFKVQFSPVMFVSSENSLRGERLESLHLQNLSVCGCFSFGLKSWIEPTPAQCGFRGIH